MSVFRKRRQVSFRRPERHAFRLDTDDVVEDRSILDLLFGWVWRRQDAFSRYIAAGGTRDTRGDGEEALRRRSWHRFAITLSILLIVWLLGMFL